MKAILATSAGPIYADAANPQPNPDDILVRVRASALNRADLAAASAGGDRILGMEWAGEVVEVGSAVTEWTTGDRVMCTGTGGFAEFAIADRGRAMRVPASLGFEEASVLFLACQTMHDAIVTAGALRGGQSLLIHGASTGVGLMGLQIGRLLGANPLIGTSTAAGKRARLGEFGAQHVFDPASADWVERVLACTAGRGADVIVDMVSGPAFNRTMQACAIGGRIVNVGRLAGVEGTFDYNLHALRRIAYTGVTFRTRSVEEVRVLTVKMAGDLSAGLEAGALSLPIDQAYTLCDAAQALTRMRANEHFGKIVLTV